MESMDSDFDKSQFSTRSGKKSKKPVLEKPVIGGWLSTKKVIKSRTMGRALASKVSIFFRFERLENII